MFVSRAADPRAIAPLATAEQWRVRRVGLYGLPGVQPLASFAEGLRTLGDALGVPPVLRWRNHNVWSDDQVEPFDLVVVGGLRGKAGQLAQAYQARGVPVVVLDLGYLHRASGRNDPGGYWQVGLDRLGWLPPGPCAPHRFAALGLTLTPVRQSGDVVLVCGQHPGDAAHGLDAAEMEAWAAETVAALRQRWSGPVLWRPHPLGPQVACPGADGVSTLLLAKDLARAHAVVTLTSTVGHEALLAGVPVFCRADASYAALGNLSLVRINKPRLPGLAVRRSYAHRLAHAQWTLVEMADGTAVRFILSHVQRRAETCP